MIKIMLLVLALASSAFAVQSCPANLPFLPPEGGEFLGNTCGLGNTSRPHCYPGGNRSEEAMYIMQVPPGDMSVKLEAAYNLTVEVRDLQNGSCTAGTYICEKINRVGTYNWPEGRLVLIIVDGWFGACGPFKLTVTTSLS